MLRVATTIVLLLTVTARVSSQQPQQCSTYVTMYVYDERVGLILAPGMTIDQHRWYEHTGKKRYPAICFNTARATFVMVTVRWTEQKERTETRTESAVTTGPVATVVGQSPSGPGQPSQPIWRTQLGTFITTWQSRMNEVVQEPHAFVLVFETKDGKPLSPTTELTPDPVLQSKGIGKNASRDALEFVFKNWDLRLASKAQ